jgi:hypothetical protein
MEILKITEIKLNPKNPRLIKDDKFNRLCKSLNDFPAMIQKRPIVVDENMVILGGNMRYRAAKEIGWKEIPVEIFTRKDAEKIINEKGKTYEQICDEFIIKDNSSFGEWDWEILANEWSELPLDDWGINIPKFIIEDEIPAKGGRTTTLEEKYDTYVNASIKQIVLYYELQEYENIIQSLDKIAKENNLSDNSSVIKYLLGIK